MYSLKFMKAKLLPCRPYRRQLSPATFIPARCSKLLEAKELWLPVWVSSNYLSFKIYCVEASCIDGSAGSENVSLIQLRKNYLLILDAWNTSLIRVSLGELSWNFSISGGKKWGGKEMGWCLFKGELNYTIKKMHHSSCNFRRDQFGYQAI